VTEMIRIDLHLHTKFSGDAQLSPKQIVNELHAHPFIKGVAITDHNTVQGYFQVRGLAEPHEDLIIIPGIEVATPDGEIILLGVEEMPKYPLTVEGVIDFATEEAAVIVLPHPYREMGGLSDLAETIQAHAIEVINPNSTREENKMAEGLAKRRNLPEVAGSDAHELSQMWAAYTEVEAESNVHEILKAIKGGQVKPVASTEI